MKLLSCLVVVLLAFGHDSPAQATSNSTWNDISNVGEIGLVTVALGVPVVRSDWPGFRQAATSLGVTEGISLALKAVIHEQRPDGSGNDSFPSGHSALAFASATTLYRRYGWQVGFPAYAVATITAGARVAANKHHWYDAVAGAAIGSASGWYFTDKFNNQVQVLPWVGDGGGVVVSVSW